MYEDDDDLSDYSDDPFDDMGCGDPWCSFCGEPDDPDPSYIEDDDFSWGDGMGKGAC